MKKVLALVLALVLVLSLVACGGDGSKSSEEKKDEKASVELTSENIEDYLAFKFNYSDVERETKAGLSFGYCDLTTEIYPVSSGGFNNTKFTLAITLTNEWSVSSSDEAYDEDNSGVLTMDIQLPANGSLTETHDLIASIVFSDPNSQNINYKITSVSGTFTPD